MKKLFFTVCLLMAAMFLTAQEVPQAINFQAIARDANSEVMANTQIMIQLTILDGSPQGTQVYREIRSLTTNAYGSFSFQIGREPYIAEGVFADVDWVGGRKFLKIDYDPTNSLAFDLTLGTIEFVSVPYAFAAGSVSYIDATGANDGDVLAYNATTGRFEPIAMSGAGGGIAVETDPTVPDWAKADTKPTYDYSEIENTPDLSGYLTTETQTLADAAALGNSMNNSQIKNLADPTDNQDAVTKSYVDNLIAQLQAAIEALTPSVPSVTTSAASNITTSGATLSGSVISDGNATITACGFMYGTSAGSLTQTVTATADGSSFSYSLTGLTSGTTYYYKAYATNSAGTGYGEVMSFTTTASSSLGTPGDPFTDSRDGNIYSTVTIGSQTWMAEDLRYEGNTTLGTTTSTTTKYRYYPNNNSSNVATYGYLYNWPAAMNDASSSSSNPSGVQGICPNGWHLPSDAEWTQLSDALGGTSNAGAMLAGNANAWTSGTLTSSEYFGTTGFGALPAGGYYGNYNNFGSNAYFWSATESVSGSAYFRRIGYSNTNLDRSGSYKNYGFSVRCLRDN